MKRQTTWLGMVERDEKKKKHYLEIFNSSRKEQADIVHL